MNRRSVILIGLLSPAITAAGRRRDNKEACDRLDARLREIQSKLRAGYTAKQGRLLQTQRTAAEDKRRELCR